MKLSNNGLQQIIKREGNILHAYKDTVGVWTIGVGHTSAAGLPKVVPGMTLTKEESAKILRDDLAPIERDLNNLIKVKVTQNQYDALVSVVFNCGPKFYRSTCMTKLNKGDYKGAAEAIMLWNKPPEIIGRRGTEKTQFLTPDSNVVQNTTATGAVLVAGGAVAATQFPWHTVLTYGGSALAVAVVIGLGIYFYNKGKKHV